MKYLIICLSVFPLLVFSKEFESSQLKYLSELLEGSCQLPSESGVFHCGSIPEELVINYGEDKRVNHLGFSLFQDELKNYFGEVLCSFPERVFLEMYLQAENKINVFCRENKLNLDVTQLTGNTILAKNDILKAVRFIKESSLEYVLVKDSLFWSSAWQNDKVKIEFTYPATFSLITGLDKKEADDLLEYKLNRFSATDKNNVLVVDKTELEEIEDRGLFRKAGKHLFIKSMNSDLYFASFPNGDIKLVYDKNYPVESISNLFLYPNINSNGLEIEIIHKAYADEIKNYNLRLKDFLYFMSKDFETYIGFEKYTKEETAFTVIFRNKELNYHHLLYIKTLPDVVFKKDMPLQGRLYTYIPNHNIKDLYKEYRVGTFPTNLIK